MYSQDILICASFATATCHALSSRVPTCALILPTVESVEVCIGGGPFLAPPAVPPRCSWQAQCLEECLEAHAEAIEAAEGSSSPA